MPHKPKTFRLSFVGAGETLPRLVTAYGRACEGEFALVMRPTEQNALLVLITKKQRGETQKAFLWGANKSDWPRKPTNEVLPDEAIQAIKDMKSKPPKTGEITLKGQWTGTLVCDGGTPVVTLRRKIASYGWLTITSTPKGWVPAFERLQKWFSEPETDTAAAKATLSAAITTGAQLAMGLVCGACSTKDTTRRQALDTEYAAKRPIRVPKDGRDRTERLKPPRAPARKTAPKKPVRTKAVSSRAKSTPSDAWKKTMQARVVKPFELESVEAFEDFQGLQDTLHTAAHSLSGAAGRWKTLRDSGADDKALRAALKAELGTGGGNAASGYSWSSTVGRSVEISIGYYIFKGASLLALARLALDLPPTTRKTASPKVSVKRVSSQGAGTMQASTPDGLGHQAASAKAEAAALQELTVMDPHHLKRAENLLAYTERLVDNPHCQGPDKKEAQAALKRARAAVDKAREDGAVKQLQRAGAELSLSAAKVARSCGRGQLSFTARIEETATTPAKKTPTKKAPTKKRAPARKRAPAKPSRPRKAASTLSTEDKDKALLGAFQAAITAALKEAA